MPDTKLKQLIINECSSIPETFELNQLYLTPDTTEEDISNAVKESKEYTDKVVDKAVKSIDLSGYATKTELNTKLSIDTKYGSSLSLTIDDKTYILTAQLKDQDGNVIGTEQTVDLPLETMIVGGSYDEDTKEVVLTLKNGETIRFGVADLVSGLQPTIPDLSEIREGAEKGSTAVQPDDLSEYATKTELNGKQDVISDLSAIRSNAQKGATAVQPDELPTKTSQLTNDSDFTTTTYVKDEINEIRTNCITEIPQDIKLELVDGNLTLKAGSKVYVPNGKNADGSLRFDELVIASDIAYNASSFTGRRTVCLYYNRTNLVTQYTETECFSGTSSPTSKKYMLWYDTTNNLLKSTNDTGSTWNAGNSLPICIINGSTSIDQIFNGFGDIGSTVFALPGVKGLIPNGRNEDGTLKNRELILNKVLINTSGNYTYENAVIAYNGTGLSIISKEDWYYNQYYNTCYQNYIDLGRVGAENGKITSFQPKTPFHAIDYNDFKKLDDETLKYSNFTTTKATASSTASNKNPAVIVKNYYAASTGSWYRVWSDGWIEQGGVGKADSYTAKGTITLLKAFSTNKYCLTLSGGYDTTNNSSVQGYFAHYNKTTTTFSWKLQAGSNYYADTVLWYACGY